MFKNLNWVSGWGCYVYIDIYDNSRDIIFFGYIDSSKKYIRSEKIFKWVKTKYVQTTIYLEETSYRTEFIK